MQKLALKHYGPIAINDFIISDNIPLFWGLSPHHNKYWWIRQQNAERVLVWRRGLVIHDKEERFSRKKNIEFHIKSEDYFGTLATVINLIKQEKEKIEERQNRILKNLKDDLLYLQKNYRIIKKNSRRNKN